MRGTEARADRSAQREGLGDLEAADHFKRGGVAKVRILLMSRGGGEQQSRSHLPVKIEIDGLAVAVLFRDIAGAVAGSRLYADGRGAAGVGPIQDSHSAVGVAQRLAREDAVELLAMFETEGDLQRSGQPEREFSGEVEVGRPLVEERAAAVKVGWAACSEGRIVGVGVAVLDFISAEDRGKIPRPAARR